MTLKGDYSTVGGLGEQIKLVRELVELPLQRPELFEKYGMYTALAFTLIRTN
jgi:ATP-dependent 26S proteasome regulatory subunit